MKNEKPFSLPGVHFLGFDKFSEVFPGLFIGSYGAAENRESLKEQGITHAVCLIEELPESVAALPHLCLPMSDYGESDLELLLATALPFVESARASGGRVLIFCALGVNRSAAFAAGYLRRALRCSAEEALDRIVAIRPFVSLHEKYRSQLERLESTTPQSSKDLEMSEMWKVIQAEKADVPRLFEVWESSVRATHTFLTEADIQALIPLVKDILAQFSPIHCLRDAEGTVFAFLGVENSKIEMLFVHPDHRGAGAGRILVEYAVRVLGANQVDVNEQNGQAVGFYERMGFRRIGRSPLDSSGNPFPLLHLELPRE